MLTSRIERECTRKQKCIQQSLGNRNQSNIPHPCSQGNTILSRTAEKVTFIVMLVLSNILPSIFTFIRPFLKWFLHRFTRLCELQRICYGCTKGASRNKHLEKSLALSKTPSIKNMIREFDEYVEHCSDEEFGLLPARGIAAIMYAKKIKPKIHPDFPKLLGKSIEQIWGYRRLMHVVERLREEQYDAEDQRHEEKLLELWKLLMPEVPLESR
uniref:Uncharacterized protein n=1 Tax=Megaselia scalaris TaxID=36166 RepID=T1GYQ5_MEGSC